MSCCPPNAEKYLAPDYSSVGSVHRLDDGVEFYATGTPNKNGIVLIPDIFGWNGGRTRNVADYLAEQGFYVTVPKLLCPAPPSGEGTDGDGFMTLNMGTFLSEIAQYPFEEHLKPKIVSVMNHMKSVGVEKFGTVGFCWGGWVNCYMLSCELADSFVACAIGHPSVHLEEYAWKKSTQALFDSVQKPLLLMPAKGDPDGYRAGGSFFESVKTRHPTSETDDYPEVDHGFIPRGDLSVPHVKAEVDRAMAKISAFFAAHF